MSLRYKTQIIITYWIENRRNWVQNTNSQHMLKVNDNLSQKKENPSEKKECRERIQNRSADIA